MSLSVREPFIGLRPFEKDERDRFFGRDRDIRILTDKIRANRLTLLLAASGVGKSSLLQAGIIPALDEEGWTRLICYRDWTGDPLPKLKSKIVADLPQSETAGADPSRIALPELLASLGIADAAEMPLALLLVTLELLHPSPVALFLDQFDEFFTYQSGSAHFLPFIDELSEAITAGKSRLSLVIAMREDFALELNAFKGRIGNIFANYYRLEKLNRDQAREAIEGPLQRAGASFDPRLVSDLIADLGRKEREEGGANSPGGQDAEAPMRIDAPHLQIVCKELWNRNPAGAPFLQQYQAGETADRLLGDYFQKQIGNLRRGEREIAARAFDFLVSRRGTKMAYPLAELAARVGVTKDTLEPVLEKLHHSAILRREKRQDELWYELYHDIFSHWINDWSRDWKVRRKVRRAGWALFGGGIILVGALTAVDWWESLHAYHLRLSLFEGISDRVEVRRGTGKGGFLFSQDHFAFEASAERNQLEADRRFLRTRVNERDDLEGELIGRFPLRQRFNAYRDSGLFDLAFKTAKYILSGTSDTEKKRFRENFSFFPVDQSATILRSHLTSDDKNTTISAIRSIEALGAKESGPDITALLSNKDQDSKILIAAVEALRTLDVKESAFTISTLVNNQDLDIQKAVLDALVAFKEKKYTPAIATLLESEYWQIRESAAEALGAIGAEESIPHIITRLERKDPYVHRVAIHALQLIGTKESAQAIATQLTFNDEYVKIAAIEALSALGSKEYAPSIAAQLKKQDASVIEAAIKALVVLGAREEITANAIPLLEDLRMDQPLLIYLAAAEALKSMGTQEQISSIITRLENQLQDKDLEESVRSEILKLLATFNAKESIPVIAAMLEELEPYSSTYDDAVEALTALGAKEYVRDINYRREDPNWDFQSAIAKALDVLRPKASIPVIVATLSNESYSVCRATVDALQALGARESAPAIATKLKEKEAYILRRVIEVLGLLEVKESAPVIADLLNHNDTTVRLAAIATLRNLGVKEIVPRHHRHTQRERQVRRSR